MIRKTEIRKLAILRIPIRAGVPSIRRKQMQQMVERTRKPINKKFFIFKNSLGWF